MLDTIILLNAAWVNNENGHTHMLINQIEALASPKRIEK